MMTALVMYQGALTLALNVTSSLSLNQHVVSMLLCCVLHY